MIWAITAYFNPAGYQRRLVNYRVFRQQLRIPLVAVELSFDGRFELCRSDADILVQLHDGDIMWQKERLLNVALQSIPCAAEAVAWLDSDVIFERADWPELALQGLERHALLHLFQERAELPPNEMATTLPDLEAYQLSTSIVHLIKRGKATVADIRSGSAITTGSTMGVAWAARSNVVKQHAFYDACIVGGGDLAILSAAFGAFEHARQDLQFNRAHFEHYLSWARPFYETVVGRVGALPGRVFHLWHGDRRRRRYATRYGILDRFDPAADIALTASCSWRWASDKPTLHGAVREYFDSRMEDD